MGREYYILISYMRKIKYYRLVSGYQQKELADRVGVSQPKISQLENGIIKVSNEVLERIAQELEFLEPVKNLLDFCEKHQKWPPSN